MNIVLASNERSIIVEEDGELFHRTPGETNPVELIHTVENTIEVMRVKWGLIPVVGDQSFHGDGVPKLELVEGGYQIIS